MSQNNRERFDSEIEMPSLSWQGDRYICICGSVFFYPTFESEWTPNARLEGAPSFTFQNEFFFNSLIITKHS